MLSTNGLFHTIKENLTEPSSENDVQKAVKQHASGKSNGSDGTQINPHTIADFQLLRHLLKNPPVNRSTKSLLPDLPVSLIYHVSVEGAGINHHL